MPAYRTPAVKEAWFDRQPAPPPGTAFLFESAWDYGIRPWNDLDAEAERERVWPLTRAVHDNFSAIMAGKTTWEDAFADYQRRLKEWQAAYGKR